MKRKRDEFDPPPTRAWVYAAWISAAFVVWGLLFSAAVPEAGAAPCVNRSTAHAVENNTTVAGDSRYHVLRGELPTCGVNEAYDGTQRQYDGSDYKKRDSKSRFCRKRWWC